MTTSIHIHNSGPSKVIVLKEDGTNLTPAVQIRELAIGQHLHEYVHSTQQLRIIEVK